MRDSARVCILRDQTGTAIMATTHNASGPLEASTDLLLCLLYAPGKSGRAGEPIDGITRLQKLMFLLQQGVGPKQLVDDAIQYGYKAYKMGPYAGELQRDISDLQAAGIILTERLEYWLPDDADVTPGSDLDSDRGSKRVESSRFKLSPLGMRIGTDLWELLNSTQQDELQHFKQFFNSLSLRQLLIFTYERFPKYTSASTIKNQLGLA